MTGELDWVAAAIGAGVTGGGGLLAFRLLATVSDFTSKRYRDAAEYASTRVDELEVELRAMRSDLRRMDEENAEQRKLKHDWRSFAGSLYQERWTIRRFAEIHGCGEIVELMARLDELREANPLLADLGTLTASDPVTPPRPNGEPPR